jgi:hypothetical protein
VKLLKRGATLIEVAVGTGVFVGNGVLVGVDVRGALLTVNPAAGPCQLYSLRQAGEKMPMSTA